MTKLPTENDKIVINETIDGKPVGDSVRDKKSEKADTPTKPKADRFIWGTYIGLLLIAIVEIFSASATEVDGNNVYGPLIRHGMFLAVGFVIVIMFQNIHYKYFKNLAWIVAIVTVILLLFTLFGGATINGAQRAIKIAGITIQPPEIAKLSIVVILSAILAKNQKVGGVTTRGVWQCAIVVLVFCGLLVRNGMTNTLLIFCISLAMFIIGGMELRKVLFILVIYGIAGGGFLWVRDKIEELNGPEEIELAHNNETMTVGGEVNREATWSNRIKRYIKGVNPGDTINDYNRQAIYSCFAQARGGLFGHGPGNSQERSRLPLAFSDYIFSIVVEDIGIVGSIILLSLYLVLIGRAMYLAGKCTRAFPAILILGCGMLIVFQALVHMAITTGVFPVSGQPLPFISKGGTSVLVMSAAIGIMLSVSKYAATNKNKEDIKIESKELPKDMQAINPTQFTYNDIKK